MEFISSSSGGPGLNDSFGDLNVVGSICSLMMSPKDPSNCNSLLFSNRLPSVSLNAVSFSKNESENSIKEFENN